MEKGPLLVTARAIPHCGHEYGYAQHCERVPHGYQLVLRHTGTSFAIM